MTLREPLTLLFAATLVAAINVRCCDTDRDELEADVGELDAGAAPFSTGLGCFPRFGEQQLYQSDISPADDWICCHYVSLDTDPEQLPQMYCRTREDAAQDTPFFVVER